MIPNDETWARLAALPENWDTYGGAPIDPRAIQAAKEWLAAAQVVPCSDGGMQIEWHHLDADVEVTFKPDGRIDVAWADYVAESGA